MVINMWQKIVKKGDEMLKVMCLGLMLVVMPSVWAKASFLIWPIYPVIESTERATALWLENTGNQAALVQVRVFKWDQEALEDVYVEQQQVMPSPPVVRIDAGQRQMIRLTRTQALAAQQEHAYRVIVDELPAQFDEAGQIREGNEGGVQFQMRYSIPLFAYGEGLSSTDQDKKRRVKSTVEQIASPLFWSIVTKDGKDYLHIQNKGLRHIRISYFKTGQTETEAKLGPSTFGYVLPGKAQDFSLTDRLKRAIQQGQPLYVVTSSAAQPILVLQAP